MKSRPKSGAVQRYHDALVDLRNKPGVYAQQEWCEKHRIGHSAPRAMIRLGYANRVNGKLHLLRERITDQMVMEIIAKKREFDNLRHEKHGPQTAPIIDLFVQEAKAKPKVQEQAQQPEPPKRSSNKEASVGIIRRFLRWLW
jgi:hypothetical protein